MCSLGSGKIPSTIINCECKLKLIFFSFKLQLKYQLYVLYVFNSFILKYCPDKNCAIVRVNLSHKGFIGGMVLDYNSWLIYLRCIMCIHISKELYF